MLKQQMVHSQLAAAGSARQMIRMTKTGLVLASLLLASQANALTITGVTADPGATLVSAWLGSDSGITVTAGTVAYVGNTSIYIQQSGIYTGFDLISGDSSKPDISLADGILLTTGTVLIPMTNTVGYFGAVTNTAGNSWIDEMAGGQISYNANVLSFDFTVAAGVTSVATTFVYGSEEFPEWAGKYADGFAFVVDGVNYARFADGSWVSLAASSNTNLNNNTGGAYRIEYDGITNALQVTGLLDSGRMTHTLEIVIADTGDPLLDSGVFVAGLRAGQAGSGGVSNIPSPSAPGGGDNVSPVPEPETYAMLLVGLALLGVAGRRRKEG